MRTRFFVLFGDELNKVEIIRNFDIFHVFPDNDSSLKVADLMKEGRAYDTKFMCYQIARTIQERKELYSIMVASEAWEQYAFFLMQRYYENPNIIKDRDNGAGFDD